MRIVHCTFWQLMETRTVQYFIKRAGVLALIAPVLYPVPWNGTKLTRLLIPPRDWRVQHCVNPGLHKCTRCQREYFAWNLRALPTPNLLWFLSLSSSLTPQRFDDLAHVLMKREGEKRRNDFLSTERRLRLQRGEKKPASARWGETTRFSQDPLRRRRPPSQARMMW